jgi:hypothetical protein
MKIKSLCCVAMLAVPVACLSVTKLQSYFTRSSFVYTSHNKRDFLSDFVGKYVCGSKQHKTGDFVITHNGHIEGGFSRQNKPIEFVGAATALGKQGDLERLRINYVINKKGLQQLSEETAATFDYSGSMYITLPATHTNKARSQLDIIGQYENFIVLNHSCHFSK